MPSSESKAIPPVRTNSPAPIVADARDRSKAAYAPYGLERCVLHRVGHGRLRPEQQSRPRTARHKRQPGEPLGRDLRIAGPPLVLLPDVRLDDADRLDDQVGFGDVGPRQQPQDRGRADDQGGSQPAFQDFQPDCRGQQHDKGGQAVGPDQCAEFQQRRGHEHDAHRIPGEAREQARAQPLRDRPRPGKRCHQRERMIAANAPGNASREHRVHGEIERHEDDGDPAEPGRHCRLVGKGGRDPVEADNELAKPEEPADQQCLLQRFGALQEPKQDCKGEEHQRPDVGRRE